MIYATKYYKIDFRKVCFKTLWTNKTHRALHYIHLSLLLQSAQYQDTNPESLSEYLTKVIRWILSIKLWSMLLYEQPV